MKKSLSETLYWHEQWNAALRNMPKQSYTALAHCVGIAVDPKDLNAAVITINIRATNGRKPRDPAVRARLLKYAGPQGATLAIMRLTTLGLMHRYR